MERKKPRLKLVGKDGNAFMILGLAFRALKAAGYTPEEIAKFKAQATASDYDHLLRTTMEWFDVR
ncbi:MAG TPA: hypothetical protein VJ547_11885 [Candidatus Thermoplasmatota archaeon]|nr:hypothetical protein [Candidatus Thermoplasmatota archaeon]